jgi:phosphate transport system substrate-binding protein
VNTSSLRRVVLPAAAILTVGLTLTACGDKTSSGSGGSGGGTLNGGGATSQANAQTTWRADYQKANGGTINYEEVGSGTGVENFTSKAYTFAGTDAYLDSDQMKSAADACASDVVEVPAYVSPLAVAVYLPGLDSLNLDATTIADIFDGKITQWNDPAIASANPSAKLPSTTIATVHRSDESGTTKNFTDYLSKAGDGSWSADPDTVWPTSAKGGQGFEGT